MSFKIKAADLFCGAGGASTGLLRAAKALGVDVELLAINHWPTAIDTHSLNHPGVRHLCASLEHVNPRDQVPSGRLHLLMAGPECTHHSQARGGKPINDQSRATAWCVVKWAQELYIDTILIENVPEFRTWGPLGANGRPMKKKKGQTYRAFLDALRSLDYHVEERVLCAADYGDPTTRQRLFIIAQRGRNKVAFPQPTHSRTGAPTLFGKAKRWRAAREIIDWSIDGQSIFDRKRPLKPATMNRILAGLERFGGPELRPFLVVLRQHMGGRSLDRPVPSLAAGGTHVGIAEPILLNLSHGQRAHSSQEPLPTITTARGGELAVVQPVVVHTTHGGRARSVEAPLPTITGANRGELGVAEAFVLQQQSNGAPRHVDQPLPTITGGGKQALIQSFVLSQASGGAPRSVSEPVPTLTTDGAVSLVEPFLVPFYGEREGQTPRTHSIDEPVPVIPASGDGKFGVVEPFIVTPGGANLRKPRKVSDPLPTVTCTERFGMAEPFLTKYNRTATGAYSVEEPLDTVSTKARFGVAEPFIVDANFGDNGERTKSLDEPLGALPGSNRYALIQPVIDGYALDIRFRMLQPHELAGAMSFPADYKFTGNKEATIKQIGNSWPGELAKALCVACLQPHADRTRRRTHTLTRIRRTA